MRTSSWKYLLGMAMASCVPFVVSANLVLDGGFEVPTANSSSFQTIHATDASPTIGAWTVAAGSVDLISGYWQPAEGFQSVDMAGLYQNGTIQQTILSTTPGAWYHLTFDLSGNPDGPPTIKTVQVSFGATTTDFTFDTTGINHSNMGWLLQSGFFQANASSVLSFTDISSPGTAFGAVIDNVSLTAVPEPTTVIAGALLLLPFGASTLRILRRRHVA